ncbi:MAG: type II secretion system F family protein [Angelakisella sp.]
MPLYEYTAADLQGKTVKGTLRVDDPTQLTVQLRAGKLFLLDFHEFEEEQVRFRLNIKELSDFCRQLGTMVSSGVSLVRAIEIITEGDIRPATRKVYENLASNIRQGDTLSTAMREQRGAFPELLINMFVAGESNGQLGPTAIKMASHFEKEHRLNSKVQSASTYPLILLSVTVVVMLIIFTVVLPQFFDLFEGMELPAATRLVLGISHLLTDNIGVVLFSLAMTVLLLFTLFQLSAVRYTIDRIKMRIPKVGKLLMTIYTARFARTLSSLYISGLSLLEALDVSRDTIGNRYLAKQFDEVLSAVRRGETLSTAILRVKGIDIKLAATILIGEESGKLDIMLTSVADAYEYDAEAATQRLTTFMEPMLIVVMALAIGFIMISVMLPIYQFYQNMG